MSIGEGHTLPFFVPFALLSRLLRWRVVWESGQVGWKWGKELVCHGLSFASLSPSLR